MQVNNLCREGLILYFVSLHYLLYSPLKLMCSLQLVLPVVC